MKILSAVVLVLVGCGGSAADAQGDVDAHEQGVSIEAPAKPITDVCIPSASTDAACRVAFGYSGYEGFVCPVGAAQVPTIDMTVCSPLSAPAKGRGGEYCCYR